MYWWTGRNNFGDQLAPLLLKRFAGLDANWSPPATAEIVTVGSVLDTPGIRNDGKLVVLGSGKLFEHTEPPPGRYLAVRGPLTNDSLYYAGKGSVSYGDPGLLADELVYVERKKYNLGILPHWSDTELHKRPEFLKYSPIIIDPSHHPLEVVRQIGECRKLVTSSLHGVIVADAFGIARRTEVAPRLRNNEGGMFKFRDYNASVKTEFKIGEAQRANKQEVETLQHTLFDLYEGLEDRLHELWSQAR